MRDVDIEIFPPRFDVAIPRFRLLGQSIHKHQRRTPLKRRLKNMSIHKTLDKWQIAR